MKIIALLLLVWPTFVFALEPDACSLLLAEDAQKRNLKELTAIGRFVEKHFLNQPISSHITREEDYFLKNNPGAALVIQNTVCHSITLSYAMCGVSAEVPQRGWEEEADAIRHFLFSAYMACSRGEKFAEEFTIAHEGPPPWSDSGKMDIHNNYVGFAWAEKKFGRCRMAGSSHKMAQAALKKLIQKELITLKKGDTYCNDPVKRLAEIQKMDEMDFNQLLAEKDGEVTKAFSMCSAFKKKKKQQE